jgi:site-specific recombinase XerD
MTSFKAFQKVAGKPCILPSIRAGAAAKELPAWERVEAAIAEGGQKGLLVWLLASTGARVSEAISVVVPKDNSMRLPVNVKGGHQAVLVVTEPGLWEALVSCDGPYVFGGAEPISRNTAYDWVKASCGCGPHALRHLFATTLNKNGASLIAIRDLLNHQSIKTTSRYTHPDLAQLMEEHRKLTLAQ